MKTIYKLRVNKLSVYCNSMYYPNTHFVQQVYWQRNNPQCERIGRWRDDSCHNADDNNCVSTIVLHKICG